uniref:proprotein convertase subtilisin/kexin type 7-like n=1 Tax=Ciona intestinalis TaxID=7719 RepID=UPI000180C04D|nr:proprotein convertase subtilisin/kexin type 7-like [Ciona intestinalis]|eukprot:XP_018668642.1 proprotein convertase subtilisin/kexin type 7-like [Ciona intestinalis]
MLSLNSIDAYRQICTNLFLIIYSLTLLFLPCLTFNVKNHVLNKQNHVGALMTNTWSVKISHTNHKDLEEVNKKAEAIAKSLGMKNLGQVGELVGHYVFTSHDYSNADNALHDHSEIEWHAQQEILLRDKRFPIPTKTRNERSTGQATYPDFRDPLYKDQWHLHNKQGGQDCNVTGVWANNITGRGVVVAVVDDGVQWTHPDLKDNYCPEGSFDLNSDDDDPSPEPDKDDENKHGTRCAGEIAAVVNDVCGVGIAYQARFSGIRILDGPMTDSIEATAFNKHMDVNDVYSCSWGPEDDGKTVDGPRSLAQIALKHGVLAGREGFGSIFVVASGNGASKGDNCNYDGYANSIYTITIAAVDEFGYTPSYAEECTSMLASTVSSGNGRSRSICTTDWTMGHNSKDRCTYEHTGTSAATPLVAGMVALMLEARPCLSWRDVQHIFAMTAIPLDKNKSKWEKNSAGYTHSNNHGFGVLSSWRLVNAAKVWEPVPWLTSLKPTCEGTNLVIPMDSSAPLVVTATIFKTESNGHLLSTLEHILITVTIDHHSRGNLRFVFICPNGTRSMIPTRQKDTSDAGLTDWTFSTVKCWGEKPFGKYQLKIFDTSKTKTLKVKAGKLHSWSLTLYGSQMTHSELMDRRSLITQAMSGEFISPDSNYTVTCPLGQPLNFDVTGAISERTIKLVAMLSCFFVFWGLYYTLEMAFCNAEDKEKSEEIVANEETNYNSTEVTVASENPGFENNEDIAMIEIPKSDET